MTQYKIQFNKGTKKILFSGERGANAEGIAFDCDCIVCASPSPSPPAEPRDCIYCNQAPDQWIIDLTGFALTDDACSECDGLLASQFVVNYENNTCEWGYEEEPFGECTGCDSAPDPQDGWLVLHLEHDWHVTNGLRYYMFVQYCGTNESSLLSECCWIAEYWSDWFNDTDCMYLADGEGKITLTEQTLSPVSNSCSGSPPSTIQIWDANA
jgi:hypothetical protein